MLIGLTFLWLAAGCVGCGLGLGRILKRCTGMAEPLVSPGDAGLGGMLMLTGIAIVLHFFIPLSPGLALALTTFGVILLAALGRPILHRCSTINWVFALLCALTVSLQAQVDAVSPDAGVYYIQSILWNSSTALVPGLANIHGRLGFNGSALILATVLRIPILLWKGAFLLNALFAFFVMLAFFERLRTTLRDSGVNRLSTLYGVLMVGGFCANHFAFSGNLGSLGGDFGPFVLACYVGFLLLLAAENDDPGSIGWAVLLASFAVLLKLSALPLLVGSLLVLLLSREALRSWRRSTLATLCFVTGLLAVWAIRGILLSGCIAYPAVASCVSRLPWTVPAALAMNESRYVLDYARGSLHNPRSLADWLSPLISDFWRNHIGRFLLLLCGGALVLNVAGRFRGKGAAVLRWPATLAPIWIGLGWISFAVVKAPSLRFYSGGAFLVAYTLLALGLFHFRDVFSSLPLKRWIPITLCALLTLQAATLGIEYFSLPAETWPRFEKPEVVREIANSGLSISVSKTEYCWDAALPCTPYFDPELQQIPWLDRFYFQGKNTVAYRNGFAPRR
jgi:hypothetical protein